MQSVSSRMVRSQIAAIILRKELKSSLAQVYRQHVYCKCWLETWAARLFNFIFDRAK